MGRVPDGDDALADVVLAAVCGAYARALTSSATTAKPRPMFPGPRRFK